MMNCQERRKTTVPILSRCVSLARKKIKEEGEKEAAEEEERCLHLAPHCWRDTFF
jgi:hypothetical protein